MRKHIFFFIVFYTWYPGITQSVFQRTYGGIGDDRGHGVITTLDGGMAITGHTDSFGTGQDDIFLLKIDAGGTVQWQKTFGGLEDDNGLSIAILQTPDAGLVVTGSSASFSNTPSDLYVFKVDASGNLLWDFKYDSGPSGNSKDHGRGLLSCSNQDILVFGTDDSNLFGSNDGLILRIDEDGTLVWKNIYGGTSNDHLHEAIELPGGNFLICGSSQSFGPGNTAAYVIKISGTGSLIWGKTYGGSAIEGFAACDKTEDFGIIATGLSSSYGGGPSDVLLCKIDSAGTLQWTKTFGGPDAERGASVKALPDGSGYVVAAFTDSYGNGDRDILIIYTNTTGDLIWSKTFGTQGFEGVDLWSNCTLAIPDASHLLLTGWSDSLSTGGEDILVIKSDMNGDGFCNEISVMTSPPVMATIYTNTSVANVGLYTSLNSSVSTSLMTGRDECYCIPDSLCNACANLVASIISAGNINCSQSEVVLSASGATSHAGITYLWTNADDLILSGTSELTTSVPGMYFLLVVDTLSGCEAVDSHLVMDMTNIPPATAGEDQILFCNNSNLILEANTGSSAVNLAYLWSGLSGGIVSDSNSQQVLIGLPGIYILEVTDIITGCMHHDSVVILDGRIPPVAEAGPSLTLECNEIVVLDGSQSSLGTDYIYTWNGPGIQNANAIIHEASQPGWYYLVVINTATGCVAVDSVEVIATNFVSSAEVLIVEPACSGDVNAQITVLQAQGGLPPYLYALNDSSFQSSPVFSGLTSGSYHLIINDSGGCGWDSLITIPEGIELFIDIGPDFSIQSGTPGTLYANIGTTGIIDSIIWSPPEALSCTHCPHPSVNTIQADTLLISATVYAGNCIASDALLVFVFDEALFFVPNVFSPNGDQMNDYVTLFSSQNSDRILEFTIYDRWGEIVYHNTSFPVNIPELGWDGRLEGEFMNAAVFVYVAKVQSTEGKVHTISGDISLIR